MLGRNHCWRYDSSVSLERDFKMNAVKILAIALIVAGTLGLAYGSFSYTEETHVAKLGSLEFSVKDKETVEIPLWASIAAIAAGAAILLVGGKKG